MIDEMVVKNMAKGIIEERGLPWSVFVVTEDKPSDRWVVTVHTENMRKAVDFFINKGLLAELEKSIREHVEFLRDK